MGLYNELVLNITFKKNTPKQVIETLQYLLDLANIELDEQEPQYLPDHPYFRMEAWFELFTLDVTYYLPGERFYKLSWDDHAKAYHFTCRAIMKSGAAHIDAFVHWLLAHSEYAGLQGYTHDDESPEYNYLIYLEDNEIYYYETFISKLKPYRITRHKITEQGKIVKTDNE